MTSLPDIPAEAHALTAFRALPNGDARSYTMTWFPRDPRGGVELFVRQCNAVGWLTAGPADDWYAVLDVCDADGDILQNIGIVDAGAFRQIKKRLNLAVESTDGDELERAA